MNPFESLRAPTNRALLWSGATLAVGFAACVAPTDGDSAASSEAAASNSAVRVEVITLAPTGFDDRVEATGSLEADNDVVLSARAGGTLLSLAPLGSQVRAGEVVARIDPGIPKSGVRQAEASRSSAAATLALARQTFERQKPLFDEGVISALEFQSIQAQFEQAKAGLAQAEGILAQAREALENTRLVAPFDGVVDAHLVDRGEQVNPGVPVLRIVDASTLTVRAGLPERYAADIRPGTEVEVRLPAYGLEPRTAKVRFVATAIDPKSRTFDIEVALDNAKGRMKPEMMVQVLVTRARMEDVLVVPQDAVLRDEDGEHVFIVADEEGKATARRRGVEAAGRAGGRVVVRGPRAGDRVVVAGQTKLIDGDLVNLAGEGSEAMDSAKASANGSYRGEATP